MLIVMMEGEYHILYISLLPSTSHRPFDQHPTSQTLKTSYQSPYSVSGSAVVVRQGYVMQGIYHSTIRGA
jgi:hypothetical protein